ncbi:hypothetical protein O1611_g4472 [Lasiodiplodia mahajangana]|uniref:Uncharacterized protein n=1 Tax=Lasiodiplodia mahajangana TaxID=1108764 RepID=A0ACC2JP13_9PEZI|nr:hypothetical protein O1611_g4472 [Lasiodiplodia mahajangana]
MQHNLSLGALARLQRHNSNIDMAPLISGYVVQCLQDFQTALKFSSPHDTAHQNLLDEFARFRLWTGNIGAHRKGRSSLDWRLRDASHLRDLVVNLLTEMKNALHELLSVLNTTPDTENISIGHKNDTTTPLESNTPEASDDTEILEIVEEIADIVGCLLRLSVSIRNPAPHDHFVSSKFIDTSYFEDHDVRHVKGKLAEINPALAQRLGKAITQRRQYFKYRERHHQNLSAGLDLGPTGSEAGVQSTIASSIPTALKDIKGNMATSRVLEEELSNSGVSQTSYATSGPESGRLKMPPLPKQADDGPFECPFCYMMVSVTNTIQWKKHINADLRPYICLEPDCLTPEQLYTKRHEWLQHLKQKHWRTFRCPYSCKELDFTSPSHLETHIRQSHPELSAQRDLSTMLSLCERSGAWPMESKCPLCQEILQSEREYARHIGRHQTELALFALPKNAEDDDEEDDGRGYLDNSQNSNRAEFPTEDGSDSENSDMSKAESEAERNLEEAEEFALSERDAHDRLEVERKAKGGRARIEAEELTPLEREVRVEREAESISGGQLERVVEEVGLEDPESLTSMPNKIRESFLRHLRRKYPKRKAAKKAAEDAEWKNNVFAAADLEAEIEARKKIEDEYATAETTEAGEDVEWRKNVEEEAKLKAEIKIRKRIEDERYAAAEAAVAAAGADNAKLLD